MKLARWLMVALLALTLVPVIAFDAGAQSSPIWWRSAQLKWSGSANPNMDSGGGLRHTFLNQADSSFLQLPSDIAWDACMQTTGATNCVRLVFSCTGDSTGADTVRYVAEHGVLQSDGTTIWSFRDFRNATPTYPGNVAVATKTADAAGSGAGTGGGAVFVAYLQTTVGTQTIDTYSYEGAGPNPTRIKVQGDPNGRFINMQATIEYPSHSPK